MTASTSKAPSLSRLQHPRAATVLAVFVLWVLWTSLEFWALGPDSYVRIHDNADARLPAFMGLVKSTPAGGLGWWAQQWAAGGDRMVQGFNNEAGLLPFLVLPAWMACALVLLAQRFVAGYFTCRLLLDDLDLPVLPAVYAGLAYSLYAQTAQNRSLTGFALYDGLALPGIPLLLWMLGRVGRRSSPAIWTLGAAAIAAWGSILPLSLFIAPLVVFWFLWIDPRKGFRFWRWIALFLIAWALFAIPTNLPILLGAVASNRVHANYQAIWGGALTHAILGIRGGVADNRFAVLVFAAGVVLARTRNRRLVALALAVAFCLIFQSVYTSLATLAHSALGALYGLSLDRFTTLVPFMVFTGAALAISQIGADWDITARRQESSYRFTGVMVLSVAAICTVAWTSLTVKAFTLREMLDGSNLRTIYHNPELQRLADRRFQEPPFRVATITIGNINPHYVWNPGYAWAYGLETADGYLSFQSRNYQLFWEAILDPLLQRDRQRFQWVNDWGNQLYLFSPSDGFPPGAVRPREYFNLNLLALDNVRYIFSPVPLNDVSLTALPNPELDQQRAWFRQPRSVRLWQTLRGVHPGMPLYVYENSQCLPRTFFVAQVRTAVNEVQIKQDLQLASANDLRETAWVLARDSDKVPNQGNAGSPGRAKLVRYTSDEIDVDTDSPVGQLLVVTNSYSTGWHAEIDSVNAPIIPADLTFQGIFVAAGHHSVRLRYRPKYLP